MKHIRDNSSIHVALIMVDGKEVAKVISEHKPSGVVQVDVYQVDAAVDRSFFYYQQQGSTKRRYFRSQLYCQQAKAGGYGYDKFTSALAGMIIDGHLMTNHCEAQAPKPDGLDHYPPGFVAPIGYRLANPISDGGDWTKPTLGYMSCYKKDGLNYLRDIGYSVLEVI